MEMGRSEILQDASRCLRDAQLPRQSCGTLREWQLGLRATQASRTRKSAECKICESELKMKKVLLTGVAALMLCTDAMAQSATECGRLEGYSYYFPGGFVPANKAGWTRDGMDGRIVLRIMNKEIDLLTTNANGKLTSVKQEGGKIFPRGGATHGLIPITVSYGEGGTIEDYIFNLDDQNNGIVTVTFNRVTT